MGQYAFLNYFDHDLLINPSDKNGFHCGEHCQRTLAFLHVYTANARRQYAPRWVRFRSRASSRGATDTSYFRDEIFGCLVFGTYLEWQHEHTFTDFA